MPWHLRTRFPAGVRPGNVALKYVSQQRSLERAFLAGNFSHFAPPWHGEKLDIFFFGKMLLPNERLRSQRSEKMFSRYLRN